MATKQLTGASERADHDRSTVSLSVESDTEARDRIARIEQRMLDAEAVRSAAETPARETKTVTYPSYEAALAAGREIGASRADDNALMALFCEGPLQTLVGAVSPELVWDGAQRKGLTTRELGALANSDVMAVSDLQWDDETPTAPLPAVAAESLASLERAFFPPLMEFAAVGGTAVVVYADGEAAAPFRWTCAAGHDGGDFFASLPFCRDDAKAHAAECKGLPGVVADYRGAEVRANSLLKAGRAGLLSDLEADDLAHNVDLMAGYRVILAKAGRLDLIGGAL